MRIRYIVAVAAVVCSLALGCAALDRALTPSVPGGDSPAVAVAREVAPMAGPWGEVILAGIVLAQNGYLAVRKIQTKKGLSQ